ncbi:hypothetical protein KDA14_04510, partial [Candidatus Saccharibacteria bacterium]|nr:hypothetical protein [Candidatus Saccharibacteria bacterium]
MNYLEMFGIGVCYMGAGFSLWWRERLHSRKVLIDEACEYTTTLLRDYNRRASENAPIDGRNFHPGDRYRAEILNKSQVYGDDMRFSFTELFGPKPIELEIRATETTGRRTFFERAKTTWRITGDFSSGALAYASIWPLILFAYGLDQRNTNSIYIYGSHHP